MFFLVVVSQATGVEEKSEIIHVPMLLETSSQKSKVKSAVRRSISRTPNLEVSGTGIGVYEISDEMCTFELPPRRNRVYFLHCSKHGWTEEYRRNGENRHRTVAEQSELNITI